MGRADQTTKVKGMFVHPEQVAAVVKRHPEISKARLVVDSTDAIDVMTLHCETDSEIDNLAEAVEASIKELCKLKGQVSLVSVGSLVNDGKVIDDIRTYE